ncbi:type II secretion system F family protein [Candidatus Roizmanbacteria bacterium]|nr:type II secretion system F family protein [Candidatus Roizmanbacteria bacterium]
MLYSYKAIKDNKTEIKKIEAESEQAVLNHLKENGYFPIEIKPADRGKIHTFTFFLTRVSFNDIVDLTRQLAIMLNAGLTIVDSLEILKKQLQKESLQRIIVDIDKRIKSGETFSSALSNYPQYFPNLYISLVRSGEASGKLADILLRLSDDLEKRREFNGKLKGALIYPIIVLVAMVSVIFIMVTFVVPRLLNLYKDFNVELPFTTQILISISSFANRFWPFILVAVFTTIFLVRSYFKTKPGKYLFDSTLLKIPVVSKVIKMAALVNSTRILSILIASGVSILDSLNIIIETANNSVIQEAFKSVYKNVEKGRSLGNSLAAEGIFPPILVQMAIVGENTGHLDDSLLRLSNYFEIESEIAIKAMTTLIEPAILIMLGLGVGFIVISVITPIYNLTSSFK